MDTGLLESGKTVLDLAMELGTRSSTVLSVMRQMGLEGQDPTATIDPDLENRLVQRMVNTGRVPKSVLKKRQKRRSGLGVDKGIVASALGATDRGFSKESVPPDFEQAVLESKDDLLRAFEEHEGMEPGFSMLEELSKPGQPRPIFEEPKKREPKPSPETRKSRAPAHPRPAAPAAARPKPAAKPKTAPPRQRAEEKPATAIPEEAVVEGIDTEELGELDIDHLELDEVGGTEAIPSGEVELSAEEQEALAEVMGEDFDEEDLLGEDFELADLLGEEGGEEEHVPAAVEPEPEAEVEAEEEEAVGEAEGEAEGVTVVEEEEEERLPQTIIEKIVYRLDLTMTELIAICVGLFLVFLTALVLAIVFYRNYDEEVAKQLMGDANDFMQMEDYESAIENYDRILSDFSPNEFYENAYFNIAEARFKLAENALKSALANHDDPGPARLKYVDARDAYKAFLQFQVWLSEQINTKQPSITNISFPDSRLEEMANWRIAECYDRQREFQSAVEAYDRFKDKYSDSENRVAAIKRLPQLYDEWAGQDLDYEIERRLGAVDRYNQAMQLRPPAIDDRERAVMYLAMARDYQRLYELYDVNTYKETYLELTEDNVRKALAIISGESSSVSPEAAAAATPAPDSTVPSEDYLSKEERDIKLQLANLLLIRGERSGAQADEMDIASSEFPPGHERKKAIDDEIESVRGITKVRLDEAIQLYDEIMRKSAFELDQPDEERILYNRAYAYYILDEYNKTLELGAELIKQYEDPSRQLELQTEVKYQLYYLLGDAAWEAKRDDLVKKYYQEALRREPLYPAETGARSLLAAIRMTNTFFVHEGNYDRAILEYEKILVNYPRSEWRFFTLFWLAESYRKRAEELASSTNVQDRERAKKDFGQAVVQYSNALDVRDSVKYVDKNYQVFKRESEFQRAVCAYRSDQLRDARDYFIQFIDNYQTDQRAVIARENLADIYVQLGNLDRAVAVYRNYIDRAYPNPEGIVSRKLADALLKRFEYREARQILEQVLRENPIRPKDPRFPEIEERLEPGREVLYKIAQSYVDETEGLFEDQRPEVLRTAIQQYQRIRDQLGETELIPLKEMGRLSFEMAQIVPDGLSYYREATEYLSKYLNKYGEDDSQGGVVTYDPERGHLMFLVGDAYYRLGQRLGNPEDFQLAINWLRSVDQKTVRDPEEYARSFIMMGQAYEQLMLAEQDPSLRKQLFENAKNAYMLTSRAGVDAYTQRAMQELRILSTRMDAEALSTG